MPQASESNEENAMFKDRANRRDLLTAPLLAGHARRVSG